MSRSLCAVQRHSFHRVVPVNPLSPANDAVTGCCKPLRTKWQKRRSHSPLSAVRTPPSTQAEAPRIPKTQVRIYTVENELLFSRCCPFRLVLDERKRSLNEGLLSAFVTAHIALAWSGVDRVQGLHELLRHAIDLDPSPTVCCVASCSCGYPLV